MSFIETVKEIIEIFFPEYGPGELIKLAEKIDKQGDKAGD
jgi:hypothetical protein